MSYGSALGVTAPTVSVTAGPTYATQVNAYLEALRAVVEAKVTPGGFSMNTDLSFLSGGTFHSATDLLTAAFEVQADESDIDAATFPAAAFAGGADGDLYFNDAAGNQIQITAGGTVNVSGAGGITGAGYGSGGVAVNFSAGLLGYQFFVGSGILGDVICDDLLLSDGDVNFISVVSPAIAADYTLSLPTAVPATANCIVAAPTSGSAQLTFTSTPTVATLTTTGAATVGTTLTAAVYDGGSTVDGDLDVLSLDVGAPGIISLGPIVGTEFDGGSTAAGDLDVLSLDVGAPGIISVGPIVAGANSHITVSGTGRFKHGNMTMVLPSRAFVQHADPPEAALNAGTFYHWFWLIDNAELTAPICLPVGTRIVSAVLSYFGGTQAGDRTFAMKSITTATDAITTIATATSTTATATVNTITINPGHTLLDTRDYVFSIIMQDTDFLKSVLITYDYP